MARIGWLGLLLVAALLLLGSGGAPVRAALCPHGAAVVDRGEPVPVPETMLAAPAERLPGGGRAACCAPSCCVVHCPAVLPALPVAGPATTTERLRPAPGRIAERPSGEGPWRPPPARLVA